MSVSISGLDWDNLTPVRVAHLIDPASFWIVSLDDVKKGEEFETSLTEYFCKNETAELKSIFAGQLVAVLHTGQNKWMRAEVQEVGDSSSLLFLLDHGMVINSNTRSLRPLPVDFNSKFLTVRLHLRGVQPVQVNTDGLWSAEAYDHVSSLLYNAEGCYLHTAPNAVDVADPVLFGTLVVQVNNRMVDVGADLEQRGFGTRSKLNAITAYEKFVKEPLCLGPNIHDPRQVSNPMKSSTVESQAVSLLEQRKLAEAVGRGCERPPKPIYEPRPVQYIPGGFDLNRAYQMSTQLLEKNATSNSPPLKSNTKTSPLRRGPASPNGQGESPNASASSTLSRVIASGRDSAMASGDNLMNSSSSDQSTTTLSVSESPARGKPTRLQFLEQLSSQLSHTTDSISSLDLSGSICSADSSFQTANESISYMDSVAQSPAQAEGKTKRRDAILAIAQANQSPVPASEGPESVPTKRWNLLDKFRKESDGLASVSQHFDENDGSLSLMNVSEVEISSPVKMSRSERLRLIAAKENVTSPATARLEAAVPDSNVQAMSAAEDSSKMTCAPSEKCLQPPVASVSVSTATGGTANGHAQTPLMESVSKCNKLSFVAEEKQLPFSRLNKPAPQTSASEKSEVAPQSTRVPQNIREDQRSLRNSLREPINHRQGVGSVSKGMVELKLSKHRVLVHGQAVQQVKNLQSAPFPSEILKALSDLSVEHPTRLQQVTWPAIIRGDDVIMVAQPTAGMTIAYLAPLTALLAQHSRYQALRESCPGMLNGPIAIILCPGFEQCQKVEKICGKLVRHLGITVVAAHGGGAEQEKEIELLNGCDILVTTPLCLFRLLAFRKLIVNLRRICHIVVCNSDRILEKFKKQVVQILESCKESVRRRQEKGGAPNGLQVLAASNRWSRELYTLVNAVAPHPLIVIGSYLEAAIYAGVRPKLVIRSASAKMDLVGEILSEQRGLHKSVVACRDKEKVKEIGDMLLKKNFYVLQAHENMMGFERDDVRLEWVKAKPGSQRPVLVVSDPVLDDMLISDAVVLVHFDMPASKNGFGKRFALLMDNYPSIHAADKNTVRDCQAHVLVDDSNSEQLPAIVDFMQRLGATILPILEKGAKDAKLKRECGKSHLPFCANMKAFGECTLDWNLCPSRHALLPSDESPHLPKTGRVKVKILQVLSACRFSVSLLETEGQEEQSLSMATEIVRLAMEMALYFASPAHRNSYITAANENDLVALETAPGLYQRARIEGVVKRDSLKQPITVKVWMVDCGEWRTAAVASLVELPEPLKCWPAQAVEVILCRAAPTDDDTEWSPAAYKQVCQWVAQAERDEHAGCYFVGDVVLRLGNTLWLDPLQARRTLEMSETDILVRSFRLDLVERRLAVNNPQHLERLYDMCRYAGIDVDCYQRKKPQPALKVSSSTGLPRAPVKPRWQHLRDDESYTVSFVSALSPSCMYLRLTQFEKNLTRLNADIRNLIAKREAEPKSFLGEQLVIAAGAVCLAKFPDDGNWHRALVCGVSDDNANVEVFFVDHGDRAELSPGTELVPITDQLVEYLPFMAIECSLAGIKPLDEESWCNDATDLLYNLTVNDDGFAKNLGYRIISKSKSSDSMSGVVYSVVLIDETALDDSVLNRVLVEHKLAEYDDETRNHLDDLPRIVPRPPTPPPDDVVETDKANVPGKDAEVSGPESVRFEDLANKSVSLTHPEDIVLEEGESCFDLEIDDMQNFIFQLMHGRAPDAEAKLQALKSLSRVKQLMPPTAKAIEKSPTVPKPAHRNATTPSDVPVITSLPGVFTPRVVWYQELRSVHLSIEVVDVPTYQLETTAMGLEFSAETRSGEKYMLSLDLFGALQPERTEHANTGRRISAVLHKIYAGNWPHLLAQGDRGFHWLRYNVDHAVAQTDRTVLGMFDDCEDEGDELSVRNRLRQAQERAMTTPHVSTLPKHWRGQVMPDFQYVESDEEGDDDFIPPDKPYRFEDRNDPLL